MRALARPAAVTLVVAAAGLVGTAPASAAVCSSSDGVTVVVDLARSGGSGITTTCVGDGGGQTAAALFDAAGHTLTRVGSDQGAVCKVDGYRIRDACQRMPPANAFWGLFWADSDGDWVFSQEGVDLLNVPAGGSVAWAWQNGGSVDYPGTAAPQDDDPTQEPTPGGPANGGDGGNDRAHGSGGAGGSTPRSDPTTDDPTAAGPGGDHDPESRSEKGDRDPGARGQQVKVDHAENNDRDDAEDLTDEATNTATPAVAAPPAGAGDHGLPVWVGPAAAGGVLVIAGLAAYLRRRPA